MSDELKLIDVKDIAAETAKRLEPDQDQTEQAEETNKSKPEFLAYKSIFTPSRGDIGGGFCVIFEGKSGKTVFQVFWLAKPYHSGVMIEPSKDWRTFVKRLPQLGPLDKDWGEQLQEQLKTILTTDEKRKLFENYTKVKLRQIESIIRRNFENVTQCVFSASTDAEPVARPELERAKVIKPLPPSREELERQQREKEFQERQEQEEREKEEAKKEGNFEGTIIMCTPLVDPVKGKASSEENNIEPLFPVHEIRETEGKKFFYVKISDEIRGCITITKDIKIKVKGSAKDSENQAANLSFFGDVLFFGVLAGALVALLFLIRYFFL